jgi:hypothetical protein
MGGETAFKTRRLTTFTNTQLSFYKSYISNRAYHSRRRRTPQFRWMYNDCVVGETVVMELGVRGIMSSVRQERVHILKDI